MTNEAGRGQISTRHHQVSTASPDRILVPDSTIAPPKTKATTTSTSLRAPDPADHQDDAGAKTKPEIGLAETREQLRGISFRRLWHLQDSSQHRYDTLVRFRATGFPPGRRPARSRGKVYSAWQTRQEPSWGDFPAPPVADKCLHAASANTALQSVHGGRSAH